MKLTHGIIAMLVTPFTTDYRLNEPALRAEVNWAIDNGATGIVATPSIGEFLHLNESERPRAWKSCSKKPAGGTGSARSR